MENILRAIYADQEKTEPDHLISLIDKIRPKNHRDYSYAGKQIKELIEIINREPELKHGFAAYLKRLFKKYDTVPVFIESGIMSLKGFFEESYTKLKHKILPGLEKESDLRWLINKVFYKKTDYKWIDAVPEYLWQELISRLGLLKHFDRQSMENKNFTRLISSIQIISHRIVALGTESEITRKLPQLDEINSPFLEQNKEVTLYLDTFDEHTNIDNEDYKHINVILNQCKESIEYLRKNKYKFGTSLRMTFLIRRLNQQIKRLQTLMLLIHQHDSKKFCDTTVFFFKILVKSENQKDSLRKHFKDNIDLLAFQVVEHAAKTGVAYIAKTGSQFWKFMFKSLKGGVIVAIFAFLKILIAKNELSPFGYAFINSLNYAVAFVLIYATRSMLATTQPAMTASTIAGSLEKKADESQNIVLKRLSLLIVKTFRSQFISFVGNLLAALPVAILIAWVYMYAFGYYVTDMVKSHKILHELHPLESGSIIYAAIAGIALFLAGLASGYYDNKVRYGDVPERLRANKNLQKIFGKHYLKKISDYVALNFGNLAGYVVLGILFGSLSTVGYIFGIPLEFRHITFSSANFGIALTGLEFKIGFDSLLPVIISILLIGLINFIVSFSLAITVAIKARNVSFKLTGKLFGMLGRYFLKYPLDYFIAPNKERKEETEVKKKSNEEEERKL